MILKLFLILPVLFGFFFSPAGSFAAPPAEIFSGAPVILGPQLSPDGRYFAAMTVENGERKLGIWALGSGDLTGPRILDFKEEAIRSYNWVSQDILAVSPSYYRASRRNGFLEPVLFLVNADTGKSKKAFEFNGNRRIQFQDEIVHMLPDDPDHILVAIDLERPGFPGLHKYHLATGQLDKVTDAKPPVTFWAAGPEGYARLGVSYHNTEKEVLVRTDKDAPWQTIGHFDLFGDVRFDPLAFDPERPEILYVLSNRGGDRIGLHEFNVEKQAFGDALYVHDKYDMTGAILSPRTQHLLGVRYIADNPVTVFFDSRYQAMQKAIDTHLPNRINVIVSIARNEKWMIVYSESETTTPRYFLYDVAANTLQRLGMAYPLLENHVLAPTLPVTYPARDGTEIPAYLTLPINRSSDQNLPVIIFPHGGPVARDYLGFDYLAQFLASRGYGVLQPNFRGSSGYGLAFEHAGYREWGGLIQEDIIDGARWLIRQGRADPGRICIVGASFGGYSALMATIKAPGLFRCAVSLSGSSDLILRGDELREYRFHSTFLPRITGALDEDSLKSMSPYYQADAINIPVLLAHGTKDTAVPFQHSRRMARKLSRAGKNVTYLPIEGGDHSLTNEAHRLQFLKALESFLSKHLITE